MELTQLRYFKLLAECRHFTNAAQQLCISQPSLSIAIHNLEDELGMKLFEREKRTVYLTEYGKSLYNDVKKMFLNLDEAQLRLKDMSLGAQGDLKIATSFAIDEPSAIFYYIRHFFFEHQNISLHFYNQSVKQMTKMLEDREIDFALSINQHNFPGIVWKPLYTDRLGLMVCGEHQFASRTSIRLEEAKDERFLCINGAPDEEDSTYTLCLKAGFTPKLCFEGASPRLTGEAVSRGLGVTFVTEQRKQWKEKTVEHTRWEKNLKFIPIENEYCLRTIGILYLAERNLPKAATLFLDGLIDFFRDERESGSKITGTQYEKQPTAVRRQLAVSV